MTDKAKIEQISPGVCPPEGCPPPTRIECIVVDKVYDSCFQIHDLTRDFTVNLAQAATAMVGPFTVGQVIPCALGPDGISCTEVSRTPVGDGFFTITLLITVPLVLTNPNLPEQSTTRIITFTKTVTLCCPEGVNPDCSESTLVVCNCVVTALNSNSGASNGPVSITVSCNVQVCLVIKCILAVQLLVPSYGFCVPAPCVTLPGVCPPTPPAQCF